MKTKSFLLSTLVTFMFAGCSSDDAREGNIPSGELNGKAYLSLSLQSHTSTTRAENVVEKPGSSGKVKQGQSEFYYLTRKMCALMWLILMVLLLGIAEEQV